MILGRTVYLPKFNIAIAAATNRVWFDFLAGGGGAVGGCAVRSHPN